jgi:ABC-2 type transport system permease protein
MRAPLATLRAAGAEVWANRSAFWTQVVAMIMNNLVWTGFWFLFFARVGTMRGWDVSRVLMLQASFTAGAGLALGLFGNARRIGTLVTEGGLDAVLALPVPPLGHLLVRRIDAIHLGDVVFGMVLFAIVGQPTPTRIAAFLAVIMAGAVVVTGFLVAMGSLAFFVRRNETSDLGFHALLLLSSYPADVFSGAPRAMVYGLVPAAFVSTVPATVLQTSDPGLGLLLAAAAAVCAFAGWGLFTIGLRRYTSGSVWTRA